VIFPDGKPSKNPDFVGGLRLRASPEILLISLQNEKV
jgi:hypothetical protein